MLEFHAKPHQRDLGFFKGDGFLAALGGDAAVGVATENAGDLLQAVAGAVQLDHDGAVHKTLKIGGPLQSALQTGGADLEMVAIMSGADNGFFYAGQVMHFSSPFTVFLIYHKQYRLCCADPYVCRRRNVNG